MGDHVRLSFAGYQYSWPRRGGEPLVMGIVNVTPDSFSDGGRFTAVDAAVAHAEQLVADGADWLDVGGESTRPGAEPVNLEEEWRRVSPVLAELSRRVQVPISIDTYKPEIARRALAAGATVINDVTGFREPAMCDLAAGADVACICMHMRGTPQTMRELAEYDDVVATLRDYFVTQMKGLQQAGIAAERLILDPGIGFAKRLSHNVEIIRRLDEITDLGPPVLLGASRKKIIGELTGRKEADRQAGTVATSILAYQRGVQLFRVHDVAATKDALAVARAIDYPAAAGQ